MEYISVRWNGVRLVMTLPIQGERKEEVGVVWHPQECRSTPQAGLQEWGSPEPTHGERLSARVT